MTTYKVTELKRLMDAGQRFGMGTSTSLIQSIRKQGRVFIVTGEAFVVRGDHTLQLSVTPLPAPVPTKGTGLKGQPVPELIERFFGDLKRWPVVADSRNMTQANVQAICQRMSDTGDCLWHAEFVVMGWDKCHCAVCMPPVSVHAGRVQ